MPEESGTCNCWVCTYLPVLPPHLHLNTSAVLLPLFTQLTSSLASVKTSLDASDTKLTSQLTALAQQASQFSDKQKEVLELYAQVRNFTSSLDASDVQMTADLTALTIQATAFSEKQHEVLESYSQVRRHPCNCCRHAPGFEHQK